MDKLKIMVVVGTRPELIRLSRVLAKLRENCELCLVHTGQNYDYELNQIFFDELELPEPNFFLNAADGQEFAATLGKIIEKVDTLFVSERPDALLVLGDTNSCLSVIPAKKRAIPIFHMEAGNRCFDLRVPEETNRKIVDHVSDINMPYSDIAREYLLREGLPPDRIVKTGSPMMEVINFYSNRIEASEVLNRLALTPEKYFVISAHREENVDSDYQLKNLAEITSQICIKYGLPIIFSAHPRTRKRIEALDIVFHPLVSVNKPFGFFDYIYLQKNALMVLSDSGTINEEAAIVGFKAVNIREAHERPEAMEEAVAMMSGLNPARVLQCVSTTLSRGDLVRARCPADYNVENVSDKVLTVIFSYVDYVNAIVFRK